MYFFVSLVWLVVRVMVMVRRVVILFWLMVRSHGGVESLLIWKMMRWEWEMVMWLWKMVRWGLRMVRWRWKMVRWRLKMVRWRLKVVGLLEWVVILIWEMVRWLGSILGVIRLVRMLRCLERVGILDWRMVWKVEGEQQVLEDFMKVFH